MPFKYIMTDFTQKNVDFWKSHESIKPLVEAGLVDFAVYDAETDVQIELQVCGDVLTAASVKNPMVVLCNYIFDTLTAVRSSSSSFSQITQLGLF